jgi:predicted  nucleic acid-binding Zn-ribbon protein
MPHQCVKCGKIYGSTDPVILKGCECGSHFFFFFKEKDIKEVKEETQKLTEEDREEIEQDIKEIIGPEIDRSKPVILDFESIRVKRPGKFEIDLVKLFKRKPLVYKIEDGKYVIDIASTFQLKKYEEKEED